MITDPNTYRAFFGLGQLVRDDGPPIRVRYDIVAASRRVDTSSLAGPGESLQGCEQGEGFVMLMDNSDAGLIDVSLKYTLECVDGKRCQAVLSHDRNMSLTRFLMACSPADLLSMK